MARLVKSVASFCIQPAIKAILGNFPVATSSLASSGRKSWSTVGRKMSPSLLADVSVMKSRVRLRSVCQGRERRHSIIAGAADVASVALHPAATAMAEVALKLMLEAIVGSRAVLWQIAPVKGTGLELP